MPLHASARTRTPPDLKWLINQRAAYLGALPRVEAKALPLHQELARLEAAIATVKAKLAKVQESAQSIQRDIDALDVVLEVMHGQVHKDAAGPVNAWAGRYGERGALKDFIASFLRAAAPHPVKTVAIVDAVVCRFNLVIETPKEREVLRHSVRRTLRRLRDEDGEVESLHARQLGAPDGIWRWKVQQPTLEQLNALAKGDGDDPAENRPDSEVGPQ